MREDVGGLFWRSLGCCGGGCIQSGVVHAAVRLVNCFFVCFFKGGSERMDEEDGKNDRANTKPHTKKKTTNPQHTTHQKKRFFPNFEKRFFFN